MSASLRPLHGGRAAGFTLLELVIALAIFGLVSLGLFGVIVLGARSAGSGERVTEQARRYRIANDLIARQIAGAQCVELPSQGDDEGLGEDDEDSNTTEPFFYGEAETLEFVTTSPQRPDATGMSIVNYWVADGTLRMSERPMFSAYGSKKHKLDRDKTDDTVETTLLYDVASVTFSYQRESDTDEWLETWDARDESQVPAVVRIDVKPSAIGGPDFYHEIPVLQGTINQIAEQDEDCWNLGRPRAEPGDEDDSSSGSSNKGKKATRSSSSSNNDTTGDTQPNGDDDDDDDDDE